MKSEVVLITPDAARAMLAKSAGNPRFNNQNRVNKTVVARYAADMRAGRWDLSPDGIAFNERGDLVNGHHRLTAIIEADTSVRMYVTYGVPCETKIFDRNYVRTSSQVLQFSLGIPKELSQSNTTAIVSLHFFFLGGASRTAAEKRTDYDKYEFICAHADALQTTLDIRRNSRGQQSVLGRSSAYGYAIFCALECGIDEQVLREFTDIAKSGFCDSPAKFAAILARNEANRGLSTADINARAKQCEYFQTCLRDFVNQKPRTSAYRKAEAIYTKAMLKKWAAASDAT